MTDGNDGKEMRRAGESLASLRSCADVFAKVGDSALRVLCSAKSFGSLNSWVFQNGKKCDFASIIVLQSTLHSLSDGPVN